MILLATIAGLLYQMSLNLPASPDFLVLMNHLGDLLLPQQLFKHNNKVTAQSFCQRESRRTMQNQAEQAKMLTSNIPDTPKVPRSWHICCHTATPEWCEQAEHLWQ